MLWIFLCFLLLKSPVLAAEATPSATVVINKFQYNPPLDKNEWVELYNITDNEIDLNSWQLVDESNTKKALTGKKISPKSTLMFEDGNSWLNNTSANNTGDTVFLKIGDSIVDQVDYKRKDGKILVKGVQITTEDLVLKGKWIGRSSDGGDTWQVFADTTPPTGGGINYFNGYKTVVENIGVSITPANDPSGIGITGIITKESLLENDQCNNFFNLAIGSSLSDGRCYKFEYMATDGVGNTGVFTSESIVKFDTSKPEFLINNAFRNIKKLRSEFNGTDLQSGISGYKYGLNEMKCSEYIGNSIWHIGDKILNMGYSGNPLSIVGKSINNAGIESDVSCLDFNIDLVAPKVSNQINPEKGKYKIGDKLGFKTEFDENINLTGNSFKIKLNTGEASFKDKDNNILNFEYQVKIGDLNNNLDVGETKIELNGGGIFDIAGNEAEIKINNLEPGIEIDGVIPLISLIGETYLEIPQFVNYVDLGATASDIPDGDLTDKIIMDNQVDISLGGFYQVNYKVADSAGNEASISRKVKVVDTTAPTINQLSVTSYKLSVNSDEEGYVEWKGKCDSKNKNMTKGNNLIEIINAGDGVYDDCEIRAWDKWGNVSIWHKVDSFVIDTTPPIVEFVLPTPDNNTFVSNNEATIAISANEKIKECILEKEKLVSGDFETGKIDGWNSEDELPWIADQIHFAAGAWSTRSPDLKDQDLINKSIEQKISMESDGVLSFWWRVSSEKDWDYLKFYIDGVLIDKISGESGWQEKKYDLTSGDHVVRFTYSKDYSSEAGEDGGWIDEVKITGGGSITNMEITNNIAQAKISSLGQGVTKYKVSCTDLYNNKTISPERKIIKEVASVGGAVELTPTPHTIFKSSMVIPTTKVVKVTATKTPTKVPVKKSGSVLGVEATATTEIKITPASGTKLKKNVPWEEIKFWGMGLLALGGVSGVILFDRKKI